MSTLTRPCEYHLDNNLLEQQYKTAKAINPSITSKYPVALQIYQTAIASFKNNNIVDAAKSFAEVINLIEDQGLNELEAASNFMIGNIFLLTPMLDQALLSLNAALEKTRDWRLILFICNRLSIHYLSDNDCDKTQYYCDKSLKLLESIDADIHASYYKAAAHYNKAEAYVRDKQYAKAIPHAKIAIEQFSVLNFAPELAKCKSLIGGALTIMGEYNSALPLLREAHDVFKKFEHKYELIECLRMKGLCLIATGDKHGGRSLQNEALLLCNELNESNSANIILAEMLAQDNCQ